LAATHEAVCPGAVLFEMRGDPTLGAVLDQCLMLVASSGNKSAIRLAD